MIRVSSYNRVYVYMVTKRCNYSDSTVYFPAQQNSRLFIEIIDYIFKSDYFFTENNKKIHGFLRVQ